MQVRGLGGLLMVASPALQRLHCCLLISSNLFVRGSCAIMDMSLIDSILLHLSYLPLLIYFSLSLCALC
jgi:hypothetical protein